MRVKYAGWTTDWGRYRHISTVRSMYELRKKKGETLKRTATVWAKFGILVYLFWDSCKFHTSHIVHILHYSCICCHRIPNFMQICAFKLMINFHLFGKMQWKGIYRVSIKSFPDYKHFFSKCTPGHGGTLRCTSVGRVSPVDNFPTRWCTSTLGFRCPSVLGWSDALATTIARYHPLWLLFMGVC
jgi:hypothetical protein